MAKSLPFATQDNQYPFSYLRMGQLGYNSPGIVLAGDMQVSPGTGLQVQISAGEAYVQQTVARLGSFYAQRGVYQIFDDSVDNPYNTITAPVANPRVDQVIARVYDSYEQQLSGSSYWRYEWLPGTETSGADLTNLNGAATLPDNSLRLAYCLATTGMSSWSSGNISNVATTGERLTTGSIVAPGDLIWSMARTRAGAIPADGASYTLSAHPELTVLGAACPDWVSSGVLTVPSVPGRTVIGAGSGAGLTPRTLGQVLGEETHALSGPENGPHVHNYSGSGTTTSTDPVSGRQLAHVPFGVTIASSGGQGYSSGGELWVPVASSDLQWGQENGISHSHPFGWSGATDGGGATGSGHNNMQPSVALNPFIKT